MSNTLSKVTRYLPTFGADRTGNVAIVFGFALLPIVAAVRVAVDYSRAAAARTALQSAADTTALMLAKDASSMTSAQIQNQGDGVLQRALYPQ